MILHPVPGSPNGRKVEAVIFHLGLDVEIRHHDLFTGELRGSDYLAINPNAKVPTLEDRDFKLWESAAIMQYLADKAGENTLFPRNPRTRADMPPWHCREGLYFKAAWGTLAYETVAKPKNNAGPPDSVRVEQASKTLSRF